MIDLYYWTTPNGHKITMFLEETGLPYRIVPVNIGTGAQFEPQFLAISPNNRIPAIVDHDPAGGGAPLSVFESGAILLYLAEKTGRLLPAALRGRVEVLQWLFWQVAGLGPMAGQNHHFARYAPEKIPYAIERYVKETNRLYGVLNKRLGGRRLSRRRVLDRGHCLLPLDRVARGAGTASSRTFRTSSAGSRRSAAGRRRSAPTRRPRRSTPTPRSPRKPSAFCSVRPRVRRRPCRVHPPP